MKAFKCLHSDLLLPGDWVKEWGRKYGHGLGPVPVSPVLDTHYHLPKAEAFAQGSGVMMHPVGFKLAGIMEVDVSPKEMDEKAMLLAEDDPKMDHRAAILVKKQEAHQQQAAKDAYIAAGGKP